MLGTFLILYEHLGSSMNFVGVFYGILSGVCYAFFIIISKGIRKRVTGLVLSYYTYIFTTLFLTPIVLFNSANLHLEGFMIPLLIYMGVMNTAIAVTLYFHGLGFIEAQKAVILTYLEPLSSAVLGALILKQTITCLVIIGGALIIVAGYLTARY